MYYSLHYHFYHHGLKVVVNNMIVFNDKNAWVVTIDKAIQIYIALYNMVGLIL